MTPGDLDLEIYTGTTFGPIVVRCLDSEGDPVSIRGWSVFAEVRVKPGEALQFDIAPTISDGDNGEITMTLTGAQTAPLPPGRYRWDLILESSTGVRIGPLLRGLAKVSAPITQP